MLSELKSIVKDEARVKLFKARYKYSMVLIGLSILGYYDNNENNTQGQETVEDIVEKFTKMVSPVILPLIEVTGAADLIGANN